MTDQVNLIQENVSLTPHTTWKIGGAARYFAQVKSLVELKSALEFSRANDLAVRVIGGGSNILVSDKGFDGLVIRMDLQELTLEGSTIIAGAGVAMGRVAVFAMQHNLVGLEWAVGIPGTVGGAVFGNSNCFGGSTGKSLNSAELLSSVGEDLQLKKVTKDYFNFAYDYSLLQETKEIVVRANFGGSKVTAEEMKSIRAKVAMVAAERASHQPLGSKCCGSTFKALVPTPEIVALLEKKLPNWRNGLRDGFISAGFIIDQGLHLKGHRLGQMQISELHANFFINLGGATSDNAKQLIDFVRNKCENTFGLTLEEEVKYLGTF